MRLLMAGFAVFTLASVAWGLVPAIGELIAARAVQGAGAAALGASSLSLINHAYPDAAGRARAVSVWTAGGAATLGAGPLIGGLLIATVGWRSIFFSTGRCAPSGGGSPAGTRPPSRLPRAGVPACPGRSRPSSRSPPWPGPPSRPARPAAGTAFIAIEHARERPMLPLSLFRMRASSTAACAGLLVNLFSSA